MRYGRMLTVLSTALATATMLGTAWAYPEKTVTAAQPHKSLQKVTLAYSAPAPGADSAFLFAGQEKGFFKKEGIDLTIQPTGGTIAAAGLVAAGSADFALGGIEGTPEYALKGVYMPVVYLYAYSPIFAVGVFPDSPYRSIRSLRGKKIGVSTLGSAAVTYVDYLLRLNHMSQSDVTLVPLGVGPQAIAAIQSHQVDALAYWDTMYVSFQQAGIKLRYIANKKLEGKYAGQGIYGLNSTIKNHHSMVVNFLRGLTLSMEYASKHPTQMVKAFAKAVPDAGTSTDQILAQWKARFKIFKLPKEANGQWGYMNASYFKTLVDVLIAGDVITSRPTIKKLFTTAFVKPANQVTKP